MNIPLKNLTKNLIRLISIVLMVAAASQAFAAQSAAAYMTATRYNLMGQVTGIITADPDGTGSLSFQAVRNTYSSQGLLMKNEHGELLEWKDETVKPEDWGSKFVPRIIKSYTYNDMGQVSTETSSSPSSSFALTQYSYDVYGRVECVAVRMSPKYYNALPTSACSLGSEDAYGSDRITKYVYDNNKNIKEEHRGVGTSLEITYASYQYDANHNKLSVTDANGNFTKMTYDDRLRLEYVYFPDKDKTNAGRENASDYEKYAYDLNGNRTYLRKRDGKEISYTYDYLNRETIKDLPDTQDNDVYTGYDLRGLRTYARFGSNTGKGITTTYDGFGELLTEKNDLNATAYIISYQYDPNGNRIRVTHPDGGYFTYYYDGMNRLEYIKENDSANLIHIAYNDQAHPQSITTAGNAVTSFLYDNESRLNIVNDQFKNMASNLTLDFTYNPAGQVLTRGVSNDIYDYKEKGSQTGIYQVNGLNEYTGVGAKSFTYDNNGNLTSDASNTFVYDVENRLISATGARNAVLEYDPLGHLSKITSAGQSTSFLYSGDALIAEYQGGALTKRYVHGGNVDSPLVGYSGSSISSSNRQFLHSNHQGSIIAASDDSGGVNYINIYDAYGVPGAANQGRFAYTGQTYLSELGMYYYKARIYSPTIGRFLQTDPIGYKDDMDLYSYVGNDPLNKNDPTGTSGLFPVYNGQVDLRPMNPSLGYVTPTLRFTDAASQISLVSGLGAIGCIFVCQQAVPTLSTLSTVTGFAAAVTSDHPGIELAKQTVGWGIGKKLEAFAEIFKIIKNSEPEAAVVNQLTQQATDQITDAATQSATQVVGDNINSSMDSSANKTNNSGNGMSSETAKVCIGGGQGDGCSH